MNTVPVVNGNNINLYSNGVRRGSINDVRDIAGAPVIYNNNINVPVKQSDGSIVTKQYDERTGIYKGTLY